MNAKKEILELLDGDEIEAICLGVIDIDYSRNAKPDFYKGERIKDALKKLDFEFDAGYGGEEGYPLYIWSKNWIIVKGTYDGSEWYVKIPRNPIDKILPESIGGG